MWALPTRSPKPAEHGYGNGSSGGGSPSLNSLTERNGVVCVPSCRRPVATTTWRMRTDAVTQPVIGEPMELLFRAFWEAALLPVSSGILRTVAQPIGRWRCRAMPRVSCLFK